MYYDDFFSDVTPLHEPLPLTPDSKANSREARSAYSAYSAVSGLTEFSEQSLLTDTAFGNITRDERLSSGSSASSSLPGAQERLPIKSDPRKAEAARLFKNKAYHNAIRVLTAAVNDNPGDPSYSYNRSVCHSRVNDHHSAHMDAEMALALTIDRSSGGVKPHLESLGVKVLLQLAKTEMQLGLLDRAFMSLQRARHLNEATGLKPTADRNEAMNCSVRIMGLMQELRRRQAEQTRSRMTPPKNTFQRAAAPERRIVLSPLAAAGVSAVGSPEKIAFPTYSSRVDETQTRIWRYRNAMRMKAELQLLPRDANEGTQGKYRELIQLLGSQMVPQELLESRQSSAAPAVMDAHLAAVVVLAAAAEEPDSDLQSLSSVSSASSLQTAAKQSSMRRGRASARKKVLFAEG